MSRTLQAGAHTVELTHPDRCLLPGDQACALTKSGLADHLRDVAGSLRPHLDGRALTLVRIPDGLDEAGDGGFYQKARPDGLPAWVDDAEVPRRDGGSTRQVVVGRTADLLALAQLSAVELHAPPARAAAPDLPDRVVVDLDPPGDDVDAEGLARLREAAAAVRAGLDDAGLVPFLKTTGSRGYHLVAPIRADAGFDRVRQALGDLAEAWAADHPDLLTTAQRKEQRGGRIYLDLQRNAFGQTVVAPYSVRARPRAPVSTPLDWEELPSTGPRDWTVPRVARRLAQRDCPWKGLGRHAVAFP